jgi:hypothetical protein
MELKLNGSGVGGQPKALNALGWRIKQHGL